MFVLDSMSIKYLFRLFSMVLRTNEAIAKNLAIDGVIADAIYAKESEECGASGRAAGLAQDNATETAAKLAAATKTEKQRRTESSTATGVSARAVSSKDAPSTSTEAIVAEMVRQGAAWYCENKCLAALAAFGDAQAALKAATEHAEAAAIDLKTARADLAKALKATALITDRAALAKVQVAHKAKVAECIAKHTDYNMKLKVEENASDAAKKAALELDCAMIELDEMDSGTEPHWTPERIGYTWY